MIYDITQEIFGGKVYPGDMAPSFRRAHSFDAGDSSNATEFSMNAHNATHIDAPFHRIKDGKPIDELSLDACVGDCELLDYSDKQGMTLSSYSRILLKGCECITADEARALAAKGIVFLGVEGQSVGNREVHKILLEAEIVVLEGAVLSHVPTGIYTLYSPPIKLGGCDGAPCRALLISEE